MSSNQREYLANRRELDEKLSIIAEKYQIQPEMMKRLRALKDYEIVIVCDDSGSMNTPLRHQEKTRWNQLCEIVQLVMEIGLIFDTNGVDIYFLNDDKILLNVKDSQIIDETFRRGPKGGFTPLVPTFQRIFRLPPTRRGHDKKLLVFVATDGAPTDENDEENLDQFEDVLINGRNSDTTFIHFLLCTDDEFYVKVFCDLDRRLTNVDVTEEFETEKKKILQLRGVEHQFTFGDFVAKALLGPIDPEIDALNE